MSGQATARRAAVGNDPIEDQLDALEDRLPRQLAGSRTSERTVRAWVREERHRFDDASVRTFVPILVQRAVAERAGQPVSTAVQSLGPSAQA